MNISLVYGVALILLSIIMVVIMKLRKVSIINDRNIFGVIAIAFMWAGILILIITVGVLIF